MVLATATVLARTLKPSIMQLFCPCINKLCRVGRRAPRHCIVVKFNFKDNRLLSCHCDSEVGLIGEGVGKTGGWNGWSLLVVARNKTSLILVELDDTPLRVFPFSDNGFLIRRLRGAAGCQKDKCYEDECKPETPIESLLCHKPCCHPISLIQAKAFCNGSSDFIGIVFILKSPKSRFVCICFPRRLAGYPRFATRQFVSPSRRKEHPNWQSASFLGSESIARLHAKVIVDDLARCVIYKIYSLL